MVEQIIELGPSKAFVADLNRGSLFDGLKAILIDQALVERLTFIKQGEFSEVEGEPTLRLLGEVKGATVVSAGVKSAITQSDVLLDFLRQETNSQPTEYIRAAIESGRAEWLPVHFFAREASLANPEVVKLIDQCKAPESRKAKFREFVLGDRSALISVSGNPLRIRSLILAGADPADLEGETASNIAIAISGLKTLPSSGIGPLLSWLLIEAQKLDDGHLSGLDSSIRKAACRLDELAFSNS